MKKAAFYSLGLLALLSSCKSNVEEKEVFTQEEVTQEQPKTLTLTLEAKSGTNTSGTITFTESNGEVKMDAAISGLTPGEHAIHIHEKSDCSAADGTSAGGHWNPTFKEHGKWGSESYHRGDIGNFTADKDGKGTITFSTAEWCIGCDDDSKNIIGKSIIVHQGADDFKTQPTGDAGGRVACTALIQ